MYEASFRYAAVSSIVATLERRLYRLVLLLFVVVALFLSMVPNALIAGSPSATTSLRGSSSSYKFTCPQHISPHCSTLNYCLSCDPTCLYCQNTAGATCGPADCMVCPPGRKLTVRFADGTGSCNLPSPPPPPPPPPYAPDNRLLLFRNSSSGGGEKIAGVHKVLWPGEPRTLGLRTQSGIYVLRTSALLAFRRDGHVLLPAIAPILRTSWAQMAVREAAQRAIPGQARRFLMKANHPTLCKRLAHHIVLSANLTAAAAGDTDNDPLFKNINLMAQCFRRVGPPPYGNRAQPSSPGWVEKVRQRVRRRAQANVSGSVVAPHTFGYSGASLNVASTVAGDEAEAAFTARIQAFSPEPYPIPTASPPWLRIHNPHKWSKQVEAIALGARSSLARTASTLLGTARVLLYATAFWPAHPAHGSKRVEGRVEGNTDKGHGKNGRKEENIEIYNAAASAAAATTHSNNNINNNSNSNMSSSSSSFFYAPSFSTVRWRRELEQVPLDTNTLVTIWCPLQTVRSSQATLVLASGSHTDISGKHWYAPAYASSVNERLPLTAQQRWPTATYGAISAGDCVAYHGWTLHAARGATSKTGPPRDAISFVFVGARTRQLSTEGLRRFRHLPWSTTESESWRDWLLEGNTGCKSSSKCRRVPPRWALPQAWPYKPPPPSSAVALDVGGAADYFLHTAARIETRFHPSVPGSGGVGSSGSRGGTAWAFIPDSVCAAFAERGHALVPQLVPRLENRATRAAVRAAGRRQAPRYFKRALLNGGCSRELSALAHASVASARTPSPTLQQQYETYGEQDAGAQQEEMEEVEELPVVSSPFVTVPRPPVPHTTTAAVGATMYARRCASYQVEGCVQLLDACLQRTPSASRLYFQFLHLHKVSTAVRRLAASRRLGHAAARLLGVDGVRLYQTGLFTKRHGWSASINATGWHQDLNMVPLDTNNYLTFWCPLSHLNHNDSVLMFAQRSHRDMAIKHWYRFGYTDTSRMVVGMKERFRLAVHTDIRPGDCTAHHGWTFHAARQLETHERERSAITFSFVAADNVSTRRLPDQALRKFRNMPSEDYLSYVDWHEGSCKNRTACARPLDDSQIPVTWRTGDSFNGLSHRMGDVWNEDMMKKADIDEQKALRAENRNLNTVSSSLVERLQKFRLETSSAAATAAIIPVGRETLQQEGQQQVEQHGGGSIEAEQEDNEQDRQRQRRETAAELEPAEQAPAQMTTERIAQAYDNTGAVHVGDDIVSTENVPPIQDPQNRTMAINVSECSSNANSGPPPTGCMLSMAEEDREEAN